MDRLKKLLIGLVIVGVAITVISFLVYELQPTKVASIDEEVEYSGLSYRILDVSVQEPHSWEEPNSPWQFRVLFSIENIGKTSLKEFGGSSFYLEDSLQRQFWGDRLGVTKTIQPEKSARSTIDFWIPFEPDLEYVLYFKDTPIKLGSGNEICQKTKSWCPTLRDSNFTKSL